MQNTLHVEPNSFKGKYSRDLTLEGVLQRALFKVMRVCVYKFKY